MSTDVMMMEDAPLCGCVLHGLLPHDTCFDDWNDLAEADSELFTEGKARFMTHPFEDSSLDPGVCCTCGVLEADHDADHLMQAFEQPRY